MSGLALILKSRGYTVQGSDLAANYNTKRLKKAGIRTFKGHSAEHLGAAKTVIYSSAVQLSNVEFSSAQKKGLTCMNRGALLAKIAADAQTIAVAGTHGKTSTTALVWSLLQAGNVDASLINGGVVNALGSNAHAGKSNWLTIETDESDGSFVGVHADVAIVTNMDPEHLESYDGDVAVHDAAYEKFCGQAKHLILCADHPKTLALAETFKDRSVTYGLADGADVQARNIRSEGLFTHFDVVTKEGKFEATLSSLPGVHYVQNALGAVAAALKAGVLVEDIQKGLLNFKGVGRRFTPVGYFNEGFVVDDYAHHPVEIQATLAGARGSYKGRIFAVIQPHRYTRLRDLMIEFSECASVADEVILAPVYAAGEEPIDGVSHTILAQKMKDGGAQPSVHLVEDFKDLRSFLTSRVRRNDLVLCMGAGSISQWANDLVTAEAG